MSNPAGTVGIAQRSVFAPLDAIGRAAQVAQRISDAIMLGLLVEGERLPSEVELARQLGVAVVTAREALETLRSDGFVITRRGREGGSFVATSSARRRVLVDTRVRGLARVDIRDMAVHYTAIAAMAAEVAADRATPDDVDTLEQLVRVRDLGSEGGARRGALRFHLEVAALSQSARIVREEVRLQAEFGPFLWLCQRDGDYRVRCRSAHADIVKAIAAVDPDAARRHTVSVITTAVEWLVDEKSRLQGVRHGSSADRERGRSE